MDSRRFMLSTTDNPFNPHTDFESWYRYDMMLGYNSLQLLARIVPLSNDLSDAERMYAIQEGIDEIVRYNVSGRHVKVPEPSSQETEEATQ